MAVCVLFVEILAEVRTRSDEMCRVWKKMQRSEDFAGDFGKKTLDCQNMVENDGKSTKIHGP